MVAELPVVRAYMNWGRWVVDCPAGCGGAELASSNRCASCGEEYRVDFPPERQAIERLLALRPETKKGVASHRNWRPGETLADLRRENIEHGVKD